MFEATAAEVRLELVSDEGRPPGGSVLPGAAREEGREVDRDGPVEDRLLGLAALVAGRGGTGAAQCAARTVLLVHLSRLSGISALISPIPPDVWGTTTCR